MSIESFEVVLYTSVFLLPGYVIDAVITSLMTRNSISEKIHFLRCLGYSILNMALWSWAFWMLIVCQHKSGWLFWSLLVALELVSSFITGVVIGIIKQKQLVLRICSKLGIKIKHPIPTAWDYKFYETTSERWVIITLKNEKRIYGKYGIHSFASSDIEKQDIYLEEVYSLNEDNSEWMMRERSDGILISANEISYIEFVR